MPSAGVRDLISAANVRLIFAEPGQRPGESDGRTKVIPIVRPYGFTGLRRFRPDEFEVGGEIHVDAIVRTHPPIETAARHAKQRKTGAVLRNYRQALSFVRNTVILVAHSQVERERG